MFTLDGLVPLFYYYTLFPMSSWQVEIANELHNVLIADVTDSKATNIPTLC